MTRYWASFILLVIIISIWSFRPISHLSDTTHAGPAFRGVCWVGGDSIARHNIQQIDEVGINWISQTPFGWMRGHDHPSVILNNERAWWGESDRGLIHTAELARESGIKTMLKPHIWLRGTDGKWRSDIEMKSEEEWQEWFASYTNFILHYAKLAEDNAMDMLCIGTELYQTTRQHPDRWRKLIREIKKVYSGKLTYAANWYKEYEEITFWDELDYIGIQGYFPLSRRTEPKKEELLKSWNRHKRSMQRISRRYGKPVLLTEIGYKNTSDSAISPWTWPQHLENEKIAVSDDTQRRCYEAMFESLWYEPWLQGIFIWKWFHSTYKHADLDAYLDERKERMRRRYGQPQTSRRHEVYFTPQVSTSLEVLKYYFCNF